MMRLPAAMALLFLAVGTPSRAQDLDTTPCETTDLQLMLGGSAEDSGAATQVVHIDGAVWLRLQFSAYNLGDGCYLTITSLLDGGMQYHDAKTLPDWGGSSAYFNGDTVEVRLHSAPGEEAVFATIGEVRYGGPEPPTESQCGPTDNRVPSSDPAVGRLVFDLGASDIARCTAWITSNASNLTAGHCVPLGGAGQPDLMEFDYPDSLADGTPQFADPEDQYPIDQDSILGFYGPTGNDWGRFGCNRNANTGLLPVQAQNAFYRMSRDTTLAGAPTIRITGNGTDDTPLTRNRTQQTHSGSNVGETYISATQVYWEYQVDTEGGGSGSPIIVNGTTVSLGIHTTAGCDNPLTGDGNKGTSLENNDLESAVQTFPGPIVEYVDVGHPFATSLGNGTALRPHNTVPEAISEIASGGIISIVKGNYTDAAGNTPFTAGADGKAMTFQAPVGSVTIGN